MKNLKEYIIEAKGINQKQIIKKIDKIIKNSYFAKQYYDNIINVLDKIGEDAYVVVDTILSTKFSYNNSFSHPGSQTDKESIVDLDLNFGSGLYSFEYNESNGFNSVAKTYTIYRDGKEIASETTDKYSRASDAKQNVRINAIIDILSKAQDIWNEKN
jgi:hypothetical protein